MNVEGDQVGGHDHHSLPAPLDNRNAGRASKQRQVQDVWRGEGVQQLGRDLGWLDESGPKDSRQKRGIAAGNSCLVNRLMPWY